MGAMTGKLGRTVQIAGIVTVMTVASACTPIDRFHGYIPPAEEVQSLRVGVSSRAEVIALLGPPRAERALANNALYYASSHFQTVGPFAPVEVDRQVLALDFDANDRLRNISRYTLEDGRVVVLDRRVTEDGITDVTFLGQLLGSFGNINAGTLLGES